MKLRFLFLICFSLSSGCFYQKKIERIFHCNSSSEIYKINVSSIGFYPASEKNKYISQDIYYINVYIKDDQIKPTSYIVYARNQKYVGENFINSSYSNHDGYKSYLLSNINSQFLEIDLSNNIKVGDEIKVEILMNSGINIESTCKMNEKKSYFSFPTA